MRMEADDYGGGVVVLLSLSISQAFFCFVF